MVSPELIGTLHSVNVGQPRTVEHRGEPVTTGIWKAPTDGRISVAGVNLAGDDQADRSAHGGKDKAVYAYAGEDYAWWAGELGRDLDPGTFGENLTLAGINLSIAVIGERWLVGTTVLEVCQPRTPCWKLGLRMDDDGFPARFLSAARPGAYLRISRPGELGAGDEVHRFHRPDHGVTVIDVARARLEPGLAPRLLDAPELPASILTWAAEHTPS